MGIALQRNHSRVQGVVAADDDLADGVISALKLVGSQGRTQVTGQDATMVALRHIVEGEQSMTAYKPVYDEAYAAAVATNAFLRGRPLAAAFRGKLATAPGMGSAVLFKPVVVTRQNVKRAFDDGHVTKKEVCQGPVLVKLCTGL
jgi:D-xylose transport system substrate-binding protein